MFPHPLGAFPAKQIAVALLHRLLVRQIVQVTFVGNQTAAAGRALLQIVPLPENVGILAIQIAIVTNLMTAAPALLAATKAAPRKAAAAMTAVARVAAHQA